MILMWDNIESFERHLETMLEFRKSHREVAASDMKALRDMPVPTNVRPPRETGLINEITDKNGQAIFVPMWQITPARNSNN